MGRKVIFSGLMLISIISWGQGNFIFNQHNNFGKSYLSLSAIDTTGISNVIERDVQASDNSDYIRTSVNYIEFGNRFIEPTDYTYTKSMSSYQDLYDVYYRFMSNSPYRSIWTTESMVRGRRLELTKDFYFDDIDTIHVGIFADNYFDLYVNGDTLATTDRRVVQSNSFLVDFHLFEVYTNSGRNTITLLGESDGSVDDALGFIVLNNSKDELFDNPISKTGWNILWCSDEYVGKTIKSVTCPSGYNYDNTNEWCFKNIDLSDITTDDYLFISTIIDEKLIYDYDRARLHYGDGSYSNYIYEYTPDSIFMYKYNSQGDYSIKYIIEQNSVPYVIDKIIEIN